MSGPDPCYWENREWSTSSAWRARAFITGAATALFVERVAVWLASMAQLGAVVAYQAEVRRLREWSDA